MCATNILVAGRLDGCTVDLKLRVLLHSETFTDDARLQTRPHASMHTNTYTVTIHGLRTMKKETHEQAKLRTLQPGLCDYKLECFNLDY